MSGLEDDIGRAERSYRSGDTDAAARLLAPLAHGDHPDPQAMRLLGLCRLRQGEAAAAVTLMERALALAPEDALVALHFGLALHTAGRFAEAAALFERAAAALPDDPAPPLNLASARLALGQTEAALQAASSACARAPQMAEAHYTYGLAWLAAGQVRRADQAFATAARLKPDFVDAWVNLGVAAYRAGNAEGAKAAMRRALQVAPGHRGATANLGAFMRLTGEAEGAERLLGAHLVRDPGAVEVRLNLAVDLLSEERAQEAFALLDGPPPPEPRQRQHWLLQKALALLQLGRAQEARTVLDAVGPTPPDLTPLLHWRGVLLASALGDEAWAGEQALQMEAALEVVGDALVPEHAIMARYDLAKFWSRRNERGRAMSQWIKGHAQLGRFQPFSRETYAAFIDANIEVFNRERLAEAPDAADADPAPVFIVGMPRSGTTLAEQILAAHRQVHGAGERVALNAAFVTLGGSPEGVEAVRRIAALEPSALDRAGQAYLADLHGLAPGAGRVVDKMPGNFRHLGLAALIAPGARIIHCTRDPRDIGLSIFTFRFYGHHAYAHDLADLGWYIGQHDRLMAHWREALPNPILTLKLGDWVHDFSGTLARVLNFLELPHDPACERFYEQDSRVRTVSRAQVRQPVNARGLNRWRSYAAHLEPLIAELRAAGSLQAWSEGEE